MGTRGWFGKFEFTRPEKKRFRFQDKNYVVAIDNGIFGDGGEPYVHAWLYIYNRSFKEWRCFQVTHFRNVFKIDAELDEAKGQILIKSAGNDARKGKVLTIFDLGATSDDAAYVR